MRKNIFLGLLLFLFTPGLIFAQSDNILRTVSSIYVIDGKIQETGVMSDGSSTVFIELTKDSLVGSELDQKEFNGEILAPELVPTVAKAPRARMREITSFDLYTDRADTAIFVDRYAMMHERTRLREQILYGTDFQRSSGAQVLTRLYRDQNVGQAALWHYDNLEGQWTRIGGLTTNSSEPDVDVFSAIIFRTGSYTIWDEDPAPEFSENTNPLDVELVEQSPFPSVDVNGDSFFQSDTVEGTERPFVTTADDVIDQPVPASTEPLNFSEPEPIGLIPAVGLQPVETTIDTTPTNEFSEQFLETVRSSAPEESAAQETEIIDIPVGATLPQSGAADGDINWLNYLVFLILIGVIGGSIYVVRKKPY